MAVLLPLVLLSVEPVVEPVEPVELPPIVPDPEVPVEESEVPPELPPVEPGDPVELPPVDEGVVVEEEPEDVPAASSVLRLQAPSVSTADNATASMAADLMWDAYISVPF